MESVAMAVLTAGSIGLSGLIIKYFYGCFRTHRKHHKQLDEYPKIFEEHRKVHVEIKDSLDLVQNANMSQIKAQLLSIYERSVRQGFISSHWKAVFYELYKNYKALGGNGFVDSIKTDLDELPVK